MNSRSKYHNIIRDRLKKYRQECLDCIHSGNYAWDDVKATLILINKILRGIPAKAWPDPKDEDQYYAGYKIRSGSWVMKLQYTEDDGVRHANLIYNHDDHTAWVCYNKKLKKFVDFDIGGS